MLTLVGAKGDLVVDSQRAVQQFQPQTLRQGIDLRIERPAVAIELFLQICSHAGIAAQYADRDLANLQQPVKGLQRQAALQFGDRDVLFYIE